MADSDETAASASLSAEEIGNNDDLLTELILLRLPIKSVIKLKSVSKHWLSLISSVQFCCRRTPHPNSASGLILFCNNNNNFRQRIDFIDFNVGNTNSSFEFSNHAGPLRSLPFLENYNTKCNLLHDCNGLLLFRTDTRNPKITDNDHIIKRNFYVVNPTTKQYTILPRPNATSSCINHGFLLRLVYDPCKSQRSFKVVCIRNSECTEKKTYRIEIYSSQTGQWKLSGGVFDAPPGLILLTIFEGGLSYSDPFLHGVFWNGALHWIVPVVGVLSLWYFNVEEEVLSQLPLPMVDRSNREYRYFGESRSRLHLIETFSLKPHDFDSVYHRNLEYDIYELERDYSKWTLKFHVDLRESLYPLLPKFDKYDKVDYKLIDILYVGRSVQDEELYMVLKLPYNLLVVYYYETRIVKHISDPSMSLNLQSCYFYPYIESLGWVNFNADQI